ncbi:MAG: acyl-CoA dehydrogenase [Proteobacteria bacterium]|nr:acyl-CoA dehydrogenase [Pseudomonadota bacterium]MCP4921633.1 acyl-CoA dehydrogenase [Pseudomonadota bacterium]
MSVSFQLTEEQESLQQLAHEFARDVIRPAAPHHDETGEYPHEVLKQAHEYGLMNTHIGEDNDGLGLGALDGILIAEELAWGCTGIGTAMEANGLAQQPVILGGSPELRAKYLTPMMENYSLCAYAVTEPGAGSDVQALKTTAVKKGDKWILNGNKMWITNAGVADWFFVVALTDPDKKARGGMTAFIVEAGWAGVTVNKKEINMGQRASDTRAITFEDVEVPDANVVGKVGDGWKLAMAAFDYTRPAVASAAVGLARAAMEHAAKYATERKTFGKPIVAHQSIAFMLAEMKMNIEAGRLLCWNAAWKKDAGLRNTMESSIAKAFCADMAMKISTDAVQVFGGYGYSKEYPVEKLMRDAKIFQIYEGTSQIQRLIIGREMFSRR